MSAERGRWVQSRRAHGVVEVEGRSRTADVGRARDPHAFTLCQLGAGKDALSTAVAVVDAGDEVARATAAGCVQRRRIPLSLLPLCSGGSRRQTRNMGKRAHRFEFGTLPLSDHAHRPARLRPFDSYESPLAGELDRPDEGTFAQRSRRPRTALPRLSRVQRLGWGEDDVEQTESPEAGLQPRFGCLTGHFIAGELALSLELESHRAVFGVPEVGVQTVARRQLEVDQYDSPLFRARARCGRHRSRQQRKRGRDR